MKAAYITVLITTLCLLALPAHAKNDKDNGKPLPPGLQKKVDKGEPLPPGWQKKLVKGEIMDKKVYKQGEVVVPLDDKGLVTVRIEGKLVRLYEATREIVEVLE